LLRRSVPNLPLGREKKEGEGQKNARERKGKRPQSTPYPFPTKKKSGVWERLQRKKKREECQCSGLSHFILVKGEEEKRRKETTWRLYTPLQPLATKKGEGQIGERHSLPPPLLGDSDKRRNRHEGGKGAPAARPSLPSKKKRGTRNYREKKKVPRHRGREGGGGIDPIQLFPTNERGEKGNAYRTEGKKVRPIAITSDCEIEGRGEEREA